MTRYILWLAGAAVMAWSWAGCRSASTSRSPTPGATEASPAGIQTVDDPRTAEERAEAHAHYMAGILHDLNDEPERAMEEFGQAALSDPANEALVLDVTARLILLQRYDAAVEILKEALDQPQAPASLDVRLGFAEQQRGRTNAAIKAYRTAIDKAPRSIQGYQNLFNVYLKAGQTNDAAEVVQTAAGVEDSEADFLVDLAELYFLQNRTRWATNSSARDRARHALERAAGMAPTNFFVLQKMADGFNQVGEPKQAARVLLRIQELYPDVPNVRERLANLYLLDRDKKRAAEQLEAIIRDNPTNPQAYYFLGVMALEEQQFKEAAGYFRKTILLHPDFAPAYHELALCRINLNQPKEALEVLAQAREKFKQTFLNEYVTAMAHMRLKDYTNAIQHLTAAEVVAGATESNRLTHVFYFQLGSACERAGRWSEAESYLKKALHLAPDFVEALNYLGYMYAERGTNLVEARAMIEKAVAAEPDNAAFVDSLGWVLFQQGETAEALQQIQKAIRLIEEPDPTLYDHLGDIHFKLNEPDQAREAWRKSLSIEPNPAIQKKLDRLKP